MGCERLCNKYKIWFRNVCPNYTSTHDTFRDNLSRASNRVFSVTVQKKIHLGSVVVFGLRFLVQLRIFKKNRLPKIAKNTFQKNNTSKVFEYSNIFC